MKINSVKIVNVFAAPVSVETLLVSTTTLGVIQDIEVKPPPVWVSKVTLDGGGCDGPLVKGSTAVEIIPLSPTQENKQSQTQGKGDDKKFTPPT